MKNIINRMYYIDDNYYLTPEVKKEDKMKVELIQATPNPIDFIAKIAGICYDKEDTLTPKKRFIHLLNNGHTSTFEHAYFTFKIEGISRACLAQLTRHRHASYTVRSQRYCEESIMRTITPQSIKENEDIEFLYADILIDIYKVYDKLIEKGIKKEDARFILPQASTTDLYMSFNLRELLLLIELRTSKTAQWEIRDLVNAMVDEVLKVSPELKIAFGRE